MTREQTRAMLARLRVAYPTFYRGLDAADAAEVVEVWAEALAGYEPASIEAGVRRHIQESRYPPTIAEVIAASKNALLQERDVLENYWGP